MCMYVNNLVLNQQQIELETYTSNNLVLTQQHTELETYTFNKLVLTQQHTKLETYTFLGNLKGSLLSCSLLSMATGTLSAQAKARQ